MPSWDRATLEELEGYKEALEVKLQIYQCPFSMLHCQDPQYEDASHSEARDQVVLDILLSMVECSYSTIPLTGKLGELKVPGRSSRAGQLKLSRTGKWLGPATLPGCLQASPVRAQSSRKNSRAMQDFATLYEKLSEQKTSTRHVDFMEQLCQETLNL